MKLIPLVFVCIGICSLPQIVFAEVRVNEIAWMGTVNSANDEWIELYNDSSDSIDINGWTLTDSDGGLAINISGVISGQGYFLLERTDDSTVSTVSADQIYSGALGNSGESLTLKNASGSVIDIVNHMSGWQGGSNETKDTMQYANSGWVTAVPTARAQNSTQATHVTEQENGDSDQDDTTSSVNTHTSNSESVKKVPDIEKEVVDTFKLRLQIDPVVVARVPTKFTVGVLKNDIQQYKGVHSWSFGDGTSVQNEDRYTKSDMTFYHTYHYPGTYVAVFEYRSSLLKKDPDITHRLNITVTEHNVHIKNVTPSQDITLENLTDQEINLQDWSLLSYGKIYTFPDNTIILANSSITFPQEIMPAGRLDYATVLRLPSGKVISSLVPNSPKERVVVQTSSSQISEDIQVREVNDTIQIRPLDGAATVLFSRNEQDADIVQQDTKLLWYGLSLLGLVMALASLLVIMLKLYQKKFMSHDTNEIDIDEITILEDE
ncbi:MAG: lamin tail domain-containing protein [Candidatus Pacebacteria bacterium]|nr:lamin tail domain-containing protein [Candidatus Paceibacterota bacterium]